MPPTCGAPAHDDGGGGCPHARALTARGLAIEKHILLERRGCGRLAALGRETGGVRPAHFQWPKGFLCLGRLKVPKPRVTTVPAPTLGSVPSFLLPQPWLQPLPLQEGTPAPSFPSQDPNGKDTAQPGPDPLLLLLCHSRGSPHACSQREVTAAWATSCFCASLSSPQTEAFAHIAILMLAV